jgi:branched-chain amino acid transport system substrate-binding protein
MNALGKNKEQIRIRGGRIMRGTIHKITCNLLALVVAAVVFGGFGGYAKAGDVVSEWEIPLFSCLTGPVASAGESFSWAANRAAREITAAGGIAGKPAKILHLDTGISPEKAVAEMAKIADTALAALGPQPEPCIMAVGPIAMRKGLFIMTATTVHSYASKYFPWSLSWWPPARQFMGVPAEAWAREQPEMKRVVQFVEMIYCWPEAAEAHRQGLESQGVTVLKQIEIPTDAITFGPIVARGLAQKPDGFVITTFGDKTAKIILELKKHGWKDMSKVFIYVTADDVPLYTIGGKALDGCYIYNSINPNCTNPRWLSFVEDYKADHSGIYPFSLATNYYDCVYMVKEAIEKTGVTGDPAKLAKERKKIADYCRNIKDFKGINNTWSIKDGVPSNKQVYLFQIQGGQKKLVKALIMKSLLK